MTHPILITGGAGFIGSHLCEKLLDNGNKVLCVDDLSTGNNANLKRLLKYKNFKFEKQSVCTPFDAEVGIPPLTNTAILPQVLSADIQPPGESNLSVDNNDFTVVAVVDSVGSSHPV